MLTAQLASGVAGRPVPGTRAGRYESDGHTASIRKVHVVLGDIRVYTCDTKEVTDEVRECSRSARTLGRDMA
jgi:hypothetical protein